MEKCRLCGRKLKNRNQHYGSGCILKCYSILEIDVDDVKNKEKFMNRQVYLMNKKFILNAKAKIELTDRVLALKLLNKIDINYYDKYRKQVQENIDNINVYSKYSLNSIQLKDVFTIYKYYNKFIDILKNNYKEIIFSNVTQNIVWDALNFGLSKYYNNKKYLEGITQQLQYVFWKGAVVLLQTIGFSVSAELLNHAISEKPSNLMIDNGFIIESIKNDETFRKKIKNILIKNKEKNQISITEIISFNSGDLQASIHNATIHVEGIKQNNNWYLKIEIIDEYDFTDLKELQEYIDSKIKGFILSTANNAAILSTSCGVLNTYSLKIKFDYEVGE